MPTTRIQLDASLNNDQLPEMETLLDGESQKKIAGRNDWGIRMGRFWSGLSSDVEVIEVCNGPLSILVLPTRGMGVWRASTEETTLGWNAPNALPVHPKYVNLHNRNGLGWLEGFNELICRCGLAFNGPPGHDEGARSPLESSITLHGRIANMPASQIELFVDEEAEQIGVSGVVEERTIFGPQLSLKSTLTSKIGSNSFTIVDEVTNVGPETTDYQLLYHTNIGRPFLEAGTVLEAPAERIVPRDAQAAEGIATYPHCEGPTPGFAEQVFYYKLLSDDAGETRVLFKKPSGKSAVEMRFNKKELPCFAFWKCTQDERGGYVAGLEPATNFPNFKTFERHHGRVIQLEPGQTYTTRFELTIHENEKSIQQVSEAIKKLQGGVTPRIDSHPVAPYCPID
ncbi:aldose 1-epimerase family protein [Planctomicrobium sp. SH668]|uniref:aldose 1-epimerase family protein n=1 Tax=Planctomicrobium sp. SH668 TaxID=3448126 RepID=UPI003F5BC0AD